MKLKPKQLARSLYQAVERSPKARRGIVRNLLGLLRRNRSTRLLPLVVKQLPIIEQETNKTTWVTIETPFPLSAGAVAAIGRYVKRALQQKRVVPQLVLNRNLIGGVRIKLQDSVIDGSVHARLEQLKQRL